MVKVFSEIGIDVDYYIPNRMEEGYGLDKKAIDFMKKRNCKLVITVDTGVNSIEDVKYAESLGIEVIVTDHHKSTKDKEDEELLLLNPKLSDTYEFKYLSGAGVALKVAQGVYEKLNADMGKLYQYMDIVMIGTVADVVPMVDENRIIIKEGLKILSKTKVKGLMYLLKYLKFQNKEINTTDVSYFISPLINSLGRIGVSKMGADFFLKNDEFEIYNIIEEMKKSNKKRRELEKAIYEEADHKIKKMDKKSLKCAFLYSKKWHPGVIGVVSSRLSVKYNMPIALVALRDNIGKASCRSVKGVSVFNIFHTMKDKLVRFGGHDLASGFIVKQENLKEVERIFKENIDEIKVEQEEKILKIDMELPIEKIDENLVLVNIVGVEKKEIKNDFEEYPYHKVRKGEYLNKIAKDYQKRPAKLVQINELKNPNLIYPKQKIYLEKKKSIDIEKIPKYHIVQRGENIISIALEYELDWKQILRLNSLESVTDIYPGQKIVLK